VEEAAAAGITDLIFVTGRNKRAIEDHFDMNPELERSLDAKPELLAIARSVLPAGCRCIYIRQAEPLGLGHAVLCAQPAVGNEPFAVVLADDLIDAKPPTLARMTKRFEKEGCSLLGVEQVPKEQTGSYGIVSPEDAKADVTPIRGIVEKPLPRMRPLRWRSSAATAHARDLRLLAAAKPGAAARSSSPTRSRRCSPRARAGHGIGGKRYDCGSKLGYLKATVELGLRHRTSARSSPVPAQVADADVPDLQDAWAFLENSDLVAGAAEVARRHRARMAARSSRSSRTLSAGAGRSWAARWCSRASCCRNCACRWTSTMSMPRATARRPRAAASTGASRRRRRARPCGAGAGRHSGRRPDHGGDPRPLLELGAKAFTARCWSKRPAEEETHRRRLRRPADPDRFVFGCGMDAKGCGAICPRSAPCGALMLAISAAAACRSSRR
jgi:UTP--glucose-1-phosphate uridylyltransferase